MYIDFSDETGHVKWLHQLSKCHKSIKDQSRLCAGFGGQDPTGTADLGIGLNALPGRAQMVSCQLPL